MTAYRLQRDETLPDGVRRILDDLAAEAIVLLDDPAPDDLAGPVHEARKLCKKARGLVRLVRPALGGDYSQANALFRDAARALAPIRDPQSMLGIFDALVAVEPSGVGVDLSPIRTALADRLEAATDPCDSDLPDRLATARTLIHRGGSSVDVTQLPDGFSPIAAGVAKTYKRGRNRRRDADTDRSVEAFHQWRKRVKYLWYHVRLLRDSAPSVLQPLALRLHDLSDTLGDAHDLGLIADEVAAWDDVDQPARSGLAAVAGRRRLDLEERALRLGARLYVEKPRRFTDRLQGYWEAWRIGAELPAGELEDLFTSAAGDLADLTRDELYDVARSVDLAGRSQMRRDELERTLRAAGAG